MGTAGGVIRDVLLNNVPVIFHKEIYAMACVAGGLVYWLSVMLRIRVGFAVLATFFTVCIIRFVAVRYRISLPTLHGEKGS